MAEMTEEQKRAAVAFLMEVVEVMGSVGRHEGHKLSKAGRCVYCSCGYRYQGTLPSKHDIADAREAFAETRKAAADG